MRCDAMRCDVMWRDVMRRDGHLRCYDIIGGGRGSPKAVRRASQASWAPRLGTKGTAQMV